MRNLTLVLIVSICFGNNQIQADEKNDWSVSQIPAELILKANAVVRYYEKSVKVLDNGDAEETAHIVITILNENGQQYKHFVEHYNKWSSISGIEGNIYDKGGKRVEKISSKDIGDFSAIAGFSLYEDNRLKVISPQYGSFPYTVEYKFIKKHRSFFILPGWQVYPGYDISIQKSIYNLILSPNANVKYKGNDVFNIEPTVQTDSKGFTTTSWTANIFTAVEEEPLAGYLHEETPLLMVAPKTFVMDGYTGSNNSWMELGDWAYRLGEGRNIVSQETKDKISTMIAGKDSDFEKAKVIYEYMQSNVRYVNIAIGIGGWQPFPAETVEKNWYGDCKALTNYMKTLLEVADIKSYYCLVKAGEDTPNIDKSFVCSQFNHAFLMIPSGTDTLFLECTSQQVPFGYNGTFTDDRDVLVIDKDSSYIKRTNVYQRNQNKTVNSFLFKINSTGEAVVTANNVYTGVATEDFRYVMTQKPDKQKEYVHRRFKLGQAKISSLNYSEKKDILPEITEKIEMNVAQLGQVTATKTFVIPFNQVSLFNDLKRVSNRKTGIVIRRDEIQIDTLRYEFPLNYTVEQLPQSALFESEFGAYKLEIAVAKNTVTFTRTVEWNKGKFKPQQYTDLMLFQRKVSEADRQVMMLKPK